MTSILIKGDKVLEPPIVRGAIVRLGDLAYYYASFRTPHFQRGYSSKDAN